eukprot:g33400.t1
MQPKIGRAYILSQYNSYFGAITSCAAGPSRNFWFGPDKMYDIALLTKMEWAIKMTPRSSGQDCQHVWMAMYGDETHHLAAVYICKMCEELRSDLHREGSNAFPGPRTVLDSSYSVVEPTQPCRSELVSYYEL